MHLLTSSQVIKNEEQSRAEYGEISPLFLRFLGYVVGSGSALNGPSPFTTLLANVLLPLPAVNIKYCTLLPSLNPLLSTLQGNIQPWGLAAPCLQAAATMAQSWAGWGQLPRAMCFRNALYPLHPFLLPLSPAPGCAFCLDAESNPREQVRLGSTMSIERQKPKIKYILTALSSPILLAVRTEVGSQALGGKAGAQGDVVLLEAAACNHCSSNCSLRWKPPEPAAGDSSLCLSSLEIPFLAIQHADNVNNANNI